MNDYGNDVPKYIKKKESSVSKSKKKSKHKHEYVDCLFVKDNGHPYKATYCKICGKIGERNFMEVEQTEDGYFRILDTDEVFEKYKGLEKIYIDDIWNEYVVLNKENNEVEE